ncbi:MAG TPA: hypothetical protein VMY37_01445 [Thermoguttaceae bacterium]|nr:hypothetical protein [Thermoguttaceae bacterium]
MDKRAALCRLEKLGLKANAGEIDAPIGQLARRTGRKALDLGQTGVSHDGVGRLRNRLPD